MTNISAMNENQNEILTKSITPLFFKFGIANVISLLALSSASMIDAMFVGNFCGKESLAAVNLISPVMSLMSGLNLVFGSGGSVRVGKYLGENRFDKAHAMFTKTVVAVSSVMIFFSVFFFVFAEEVTSFLGAEEGPLHSLAAAYLRAVSPFFLTWGLVYTFSLFIRVDGRPKLATFGLLSTAVINIALDALFIVGFQWGVSGAALATGLSSVGPTAVFLVYILFFSKNLKLKRPDGRWHELLLAAFNGSSEFLSEISAGVVVFLFNRIMIAGFGTDGVAAFTAINYILWFGQMTLYAVSDAITPLVSVNYGAGRRDRIRGILKISRITAFAFSAGCILFLTFFGDAAVHLFLDDKSSKAYEIGCEFTKYIRFAFFFIGFNMINSAWMTAVHRPVESLLISGARALVLPVLFLTFFPKAFGIHGIYTAVPVAEAVTLLISAALIFRLRRKIGQENSGI